MRPTLVRYEKLKNLGNYENEKVGVEVQVDDGESPKEAVERARKFVEKQLKGKDDNYEIEQARRVVASPDDYTGRRVKEAEELLARYEAEASDDDF